MRSPQLNPGRRGFKGRSQLTIALQESALTRSEMLRLLRKAGYEARAVAGGGEGILCISIRCRDRRDAARLAMRLDRVRGVAVASSESEPER